VLTGDVSWSQIIHTYELTLGGQRIPQGHHGYALFSAIAVVVIVATSILGSAVILFRRREWSLWTLTVGLALSPFLTVTFAIYILHAYQGRHVIYQFAGVLFGLGILLGPILNRLSRPAFLGLVMLLCLACARHQVRLYELTRQDRLTELANMNTSPTVTAMLRSNPSLPIFAPVETCLLESFYGTPLVRAHLYCVYSASREIRYIGTDTVARTSIVLATQPGFQIVPYETMLSTPGPRLLVHRFEPWEEWIEDSLQADGVKTTPLGKGVSGDLLELSPSH
jgi:hypothetical protein